MLRLLSYFWHAKIPVLFCPTTHVKTKMFMAQMESTELRLPLLIFRLLLLCGDLSEMR